jgi:cobalt/nickel transport system ATP-binding protein
MSDPAAVEVEGLSFRYPDGTPALDRVSFTVRAGERVALVGANGAGKSTVLLHLNGLLEGQGRVTVCGLPVERKSFRAVRQKVGLVFQNPDDQLFCPTVYEDVAFGPRNLDLPEEQVRTRVAESLAAVGLAGFEGRSAYHLSFGQKRRAALATVLALRAELLALDEPTSFLDPKGRRQFTRLLQELGGTQIVATHDFGLVETLCDRVLVLDGGKLVAQGAPARLLRDHALLEKHGLE